jgi:DNA-binding LacI/PurR family transcriptional regulator
MRKRSGIGIRELASRLGMSISTVSRAMNDSADVSLETRDRIRAEAERLGYRPNQSGRSLRSGSTNTVALTMRTDIGRTVAGETFFMALSEGLQGSLASAGMDLVILPCSSDQDQNEFLYRAVDRHLADAFIISNIQRYDARLDYLLKAEVPFVALGSSETKGDYAALDLDFDSVAADAVSRFVKSGRTRIVLGLTSQETNSNFKFLEGYRRGLNDAGLPYDDALVLRPYDRIAGGHEIGSSLLDIDPRPDAVLLIQETMAMGLYQKLQASGLEPGRDVAVIGFRENPVCRYLSPSLTSYRVDLRHYGHRLGEMMINELAADRVSSNITNVPRLELWPMSLIEGRSG